MPSERFLRLPEEKQNLIWEAAMEEFTSVPFEKVSINKIIQKAGISRGSFYTYFEDKRDVLSFILKSTKEQWMAFCVEYLNEHNGDFWGMMEELIRLAVDFCKENNLVQFHQNLLMYPGASFLECPHEDEFSEDNLMIYKHVDCRLFREHSLEFFSVVMEQALMSAVTSIAAFYKKPEREVQIVSEFKKKLQVIRYGACVAPSKERMED